MEPFPENFLIYDKYFQRSQEIKFISIKMEFSETIKK